MRAYERLINYAKIHTTSDEESTTVPTTSRQFDLARFLEKEMREAAAALDFERAAELRDMIFELKSEN